MTDENDRVTRTFPDTPERPVEPAVVKVFLEQAQGELSRMWAVNEPTQIQWTVWRPCGDSLTSESLAIPNYFAEKGIDLEAVRQLPGIANFLDYLWKNGRHRISLTGQNPSRNSWELDVLVEVLATPLRTALTHAALDEVVECGQASNWVLPKARHEQLLGDLVDIHCRGILRFNVKCPLYWVTGEQCDLGDGVKL